MRNLLKCCFFLINIVVFITSVNAQRRIDYGIVVNPGYSWINSKKPIGAEGLTKTGSYTINYGLIGKYYLNKTIAIQTGIHMYNFSYKCYINRYEFQFPAIDSENKSYLRQITGDSISENTNISTIQIPISFVYEFSLSRNIQLFASIGPAFSLPVKSNIKAYGTFTYKGYYENGNYVLENIPVYGFNTDVPVEKDGKLEASFFSIYGTAAVGCNFTITRYWKFSLVANYTRSITAIVKRSSDEYTLSDKLGSFHSILGNNTSLNNISFGFSLQKILLF